VSKYGRQRNHQKKETIQKQKKLGLRHQKTQILLLVKKIRNKYFKKTGASPEGTRYFFLSRSPILALGLFSTITGTLKQGNV
jgi:hypothetical protein